MAKIKLVKRVKYAGDIHRKLVELGWDLDTAALFCDDLPDAEVEPVRHGEWLLKHIGHGHYWECSECHTNPCIYVTENTKFCPNCGAWMDLGGADNG